MRHPQVFSGNDADVDRESVLSLGRQFDRIFLR